MNVRTTFRSCQVCATNEAVALSELNYRLFDDVSVPRTMLLSQCTNCGFIFNDTTATEEELASYYDSQDYYLESAGGGTGGSSRSDISRYEKIGSILSLDSMPQQRTLLDLGCGKGGFLKWVEESYNITPIGVEASAACRRALKTDTQFQIFQKMEEIEGERVDIVVLSHVLEHLLHPLDFLKKIKKYIQPDSVVYCEVPNGLKYLKTNYDWSVMYFEHINHFTKESLCNLFQEAGFDLLVAQEVPFDAASPQDECVCVKAALVSTQSSKRQKCKKIIAESFPAVPVSAKKEGNYCLWGISQYAQLLLGSNPHFFELIDFFYDSSSAKVGRMVGGKEVLHSRNISNLTAKDTIYIPSSPYVPEMEQWLIDNAFPGQYYIL